MKQLALTMMLALMSAAPAFAQYGGGELFTFKNDTQFSLRMRLVSPSGDSRQDSVFDLRRGEDQEFQLLPGWKARVEFGYGSGYQPVELNVESGSKHRAFMRGGVPTFSSEYGKNDDSPVIVGRGRKLQIQNDTGSEFTIVKYGPGGEVSENRLADRRTADVQLLNGWSARIRTRDGSEVSLFKPQDSKKYVFYRGRHGIHYKVEDASSGDQQNNKLANALGVQLSEIGNNELKINRVSYGGLAQELRLAVGDIIVGQAAIGAQDRWGNPKDGLFLTGLKIRTSRGYVFDINLQNGGEPIWIR